MMSASCRRMVALWGVGITCCLLGAGSALAASKETSRRPNIVFILVDDMRFDAMSCAGHPFLRTPNIDRIARTGARFNNGFVTTSLCSPARASFLTGDYAHTHGVTVNAQMEIDPKVPNYGQLLQKAGYETAFIGKWHMSGDPKPRPGFDYWLSFPQQGIYIDPDLNENGRDFKAKGYMTDLLTDYTVKYLERGRDKPFCLSLSHKAVHAEFTPADRHKGLFSPEYIKAPRSWEDDLSDKPLWQRTLFLRGGRLQKPIPEGGIPDALPPVAWDCRDWRNTTRLNYYRTLMAVDDSVGRVLDTLEKLGLADNTVVIFAGDNGFFMGEHRRCDKRMAFDESLRIPFLIGGAGVVDPGRVVPGMVLNIDVAPTLLDLAGVEPPAAMQGKSLKPFMDGQAPTWRTSFLYEYFREDWLPGIPTMQAVRTDDFKYIRYPDINDTNELYDLAFDPMEMRNLIADPAHADKLKEMKAELDRLLKETGAR